MRARHHVIRYDNPYNGAHGACGVSIFETGADTTVVVLTELPSNPGMSVTNALEHIATKVRGAFLASNAPTEIIWVERYLQGTQADGSAGETFDLVHLEWDGQHYGKPHWRPIGDRSQGDFWRHLFGIEHPRETLPDFATVRIVE